jgi:zinc-binding in reverse transcriptase
MDVEVERADQNSLWCETVQLIYGTTDIHSIPTAHCSTFIKSLHPLIPFMNISCLEVHNGISWRWSLDGSFTVSSAYKTMHESGVTTQYHRILWKIKAPYKVKVFFWLLLNNRLYIDTADFAAQKTQLRTEMLPLW